ncbi:MAG: 4-hydroxythreonine-4-phosphate dehydrogenase PdxA [Bacteroidetes bacterium HGW-Bacteroidetes-12]|nr:MAG: 4-hydroxythreonine-4-phosphate dehydrogenase PdxA [Bacteroidetes bacterium HGW-Bacteroidetes-12]
MLNIEKIKIGISIGDVNGIGLEVIIKTFMDNRMLDFCTPIVYGSTKLANNYRKTMDATDFAFNRIATIEEANPKKVNMLSCWNEEVELSFGHSTESGGKYAFLSLDAACKDLFDGKIDALVTAPINKDNIQSEAFNFPGHTEYLTEKFEGESLMLLTSENLKVGIATNHIPVANISNSLTSDSIFNKIKILNKSLIQDFAISSPKIAILALNPHAGDNGLLGKEEHQVIIPAINNAKSIGINAFGPYPADGFFGAGSYKKFDAVLAMYHDQGLIPFKTLSFGEGVNFTAGLNIVRTSPDHGVAYEIAGQNKAAESSFRSAVYLACDIVRNRTIHNEINRDKLKIKRQ